MQKLPWSLLALLFSISACKPTTPSSSTQTSKADSRPQIQATNYPLHYFATRLGAEDVQVQLRTPKDEDPAFWQPTDEDVRALQEADLILMNGATYSKWADKVTLPTSKVVDTSAAFQKDFIQIAEDSTHSHGPEGEHSHSGTAFTTWLDMQQATQQAEAIANALTTLLGSEKSASIQKRLADLKADLSSLDQRLLGASKKIASTPLVASHPVYHYFARRYALNLQSVLWEPETVPDDAAMQNLQKILSTHPAKWMIWEGEPAEESVKKLAAIGIQSIVFDPCGNVPDEGDWLSVFKANLTNLEKAFP